MKISKMKQAICDVWLQEEIIGNSIPNYYPDFLWNLQQFMSSLHKNEN